MDLVMPGVDGITATRLVHDSSPETRVLVLSSFADHERVLPALQAGAEGYLTKDTPPERVAEAVRSIHSGEPVFSAEVLRRLTEHAVGGRSRPEGTVTIVFTDVEGSTRLVDELGDEESRAELREHDEVVRQRLRDHGGIEVGHVFLPPLPPGELMASADAQLPIEPEHLAVALGHGDAADAVRVWSTLVEGLGLAEPSLEEARPPGMHPTRSAHILVSGRRLGTIRSRLS